MNNALLIPLLLAASIIGMVVVCRVAGDIWREMHGGLGDEDETQAARRTEERKNERIRKEIERWREGK